MKMFTSAKILPAVLLLSVTLSSTPTIAGTIIDFGTGNAIQAGNITIAGINISGSGIPVDALGISGAPSNNGFFDTSGTVANPADPDDQTSAALSFNTDPNNNFIQIIGGIPAFGIPNGTTLLSGKISSFQIFNTQGIIVFSNAIGLDSKNPALLEAIGLPANTPFNFFAFSIASQSSGKAFSTDIANTTVVPEPSSLLLLGSCVVALGWLRRKHNS